MTSIQDRIRTLEDELKTLERQYDVSLEAWEFTIDLALREGLRAQQAHIERRQNEVTHELELLNSGQHSEASIAQIEKNLIETWTTQQHQVDLRLPLDSLASILKSLNRRQGGAALVLIPQLSRSRAESLLERARAWLQHDQQAVVQPYPLTFGMDAGLSETVVVNALLRELGLPQEGSREERISRFVDTLFESNRSSNRVVSLEMKLTRAQHSAPTLQAFFDGFIQHVWARLVEALPKAAEQAPYLRLVVFILADVTESVLPAGAWIAAPDTRVDRCTLIRISNWEQVDLEEWLDKHSGLRDHKYESAQLSHIAFTAHSQGDDGVPRHTWTYLRQQLDDELTAIRKRLLDGPLAAVPVRR